MRQAIRVPQFVHERASFYLVGLTGSSPEAQCDEGVGASDIGYPGGCVDSARRYR